MNKIPEHHKDFSFYNDFLSGNVPLPPKLRLVHRLQLLGKTLQILLQFQEDQFCFARTSSFLTNNKVIFGFNFSSVLGPIPLTFNRSSMLLNGP